MTKGPWASCVALIFSVAYLFSEGLDHSLLLSCTKLELEVNRRVFVSEDNIGLARTFRITLLIRRTTPSFNIIQCSSLFLPRLGTRPGHSGKVGNKSPAPGLFATGINRIIMASCRCPTRLLPSCLVCVIYWTEMLLTDFLPLFFKCGNSGASRTPSFWRLGEIVLSQFTDADKANV